MTLSLENLIIFLLFLLLGLTAHTYTRNYVPHPKPLTVLEDIVAALQNAVLVHLVGLLGLVVLILLWQQFRGPLDQDLLLINGIPGYFREHPIRTSIFVLLYTGYLLLAGPAFGALNVYRRVSGRLLSGLNFIGRRPPPAGSPPWHVSMPIEKSSLMANQSPQ